MVVSLENLQGFTVHTSGGKFYVKAGGPDSAATYIRETYPQFVVIMVRTDEQEIMASLEKGFE